MLSLVRRLLLRCIKITSGLPSAVSAENRVMEAIQRKQIPGWSRGGGCLGCSWGSDSSEHLVKCPPTVRDKHLRNGICLFCDGLGNHHCIHCGSVRAHLSLAPFDSKWYTRDYAKIGLKKINFGNNGNYNYNSKPFFKKKNSFRNFNNNFRGRGGSFRGNTGRNNYNNYNNNSSIKTGNGNGNGGVPSEGTSATENKEKN